MSIRIVFLKKAFKSNYLAMQRVGDGLSCGHSLALTVSPTYASYFLKCKKAYKLLRQIDVDCPAFPMFESEAAK